jgi:hypothetical protein
VNGRWRSKLDYRRRWRRRQRWSARDSARRKQRQRIDVPLRIGGHAHAEVNVRDVVLGSSARPDSADRRSFLHGIALPHGDVAEVDERNGVPVTGLDGDDLAVSADRARERDDPCGRSAHSRIARVGDVDPTVLAARIRVTAVDKLLQHFPGCRPTPGVCS